MIFETEDGREIVVVLPRQLDTGQNRHNVIRLDTRTAPGYEERKMSLKKRIRGYKMEDLEEMLDVLEETIRYRYREREAMEEALSEVRELHGKKMREYEAEQNQEAEG